MAAEIPRSITDIEQDLARAQAEHSRADSALRDRREELIKAQAVVIGWDPELSYFARHAAGILAFAQEHGLDPKWLADKVGQAMYEVGRDHDSEKAELTAEGWYRAGIRFLGQDHYKEGPFLSSARSAFFTAEQVALTEERRNPDVNPLARDSFFYKFLAENLAGALKEIVHDNFWDNY